MTTIVLPPDLEADLTQQATREGTTVESLAIDGLRQLVASKSTAPVPPRNLLEFLGDFVGCVDGDSDETLSENCGEKFTDYLVEKKRAGKL